jgi:hypothetical protein
MTNAGSNMQYACTNGTEEILAFKTLKDFKKLVACVMDNNRNK